MKLIHNFQVVYELGTFEEPLRVPLHNLSLAMVMGISADSFLRFAESIFGLGLSTGKTIKTLDYEIRQKLSLLMGETNISFNFYSATY